MALYPYRNRSQFKLQPGARGESFNTNFPGYNFEDDRVNRTGMRLAMNEHDTPNIKWMIDPTLPVLFRYGYAFGFNQLVITKGRIVAVDPYMIGTDFESNKHFPALTLANGGAATRYRKTTGDVYTAEMPLSDASLIGKTIANPGKDHYAHADCWNGKVFSPANAGVTLTAQLSKLGYTYDAIKGILKGGDATAAKAEGARVPNVPIGVIIRNEYTRDDDAFNGMQPGAVNTNAMLELPYFEAKDKAEGNPWGSAYGDLKPGDLVKSDENGRVVKSPLSDEAFMAAAGIPEYEYERQQVIGQVYSLSPDLTPEGAAKYAQWALNDRLDFEDLNPLSWATNNRRGEDFVTRSAYKTQNQYPGYPYDKNFGNHDLHMLGATRGNYDLRTELQYQLQNGIPGLTDGKNVTTVKDITQKSGGVMILKGAGKNKDIELFFRIPAVDVVNLRVALVPHGAAPANFVAAKEGTYMKANTTDLGKFDYVNELQGIFTVKVEGAKADAITGTVLDADGKELPWDLYVQYDKKGEAGVPTFMDWDGCSGSVKVLLQK